MSILNSDFYLFYRFVLEIYDDTLGFLFFAMHPRILFYYLFSSLLFFPLDTETVRRQRKCLGNLISTREYSFFVFVSTLKMHNGRCVRRGKLISRSDR